MGTSQPFYWAAKDGWFLWIRDVAGKRKRIFLAKPKNAAWIIRKDRLAGKSEEYGNPRFAEVGSQWLARQQIRRDRVDSQLWLDRVTRTLDAFSRANRGIRVAQSRRPWLLSGWAPAQRPTNTLRSVPLKQALKWAVQQQLISRSPLDGMKLSKGKRREAVLTIDQHRQLIKGANV